MTEVERLRGEQGQPNRLLAEEILRQSYLEAMHAAANEPRASLNVYGSTCPFCCGDLDHVAFLRSGAAACQFCRNKEPAPEQSTVRLVVAPSGILSGIEIWAGARLNAPANK